VCADPKSAKRQSSHQCRFALFGSTSTKPACKTLVNPLFFAYLSLHATFLSLSLSLTHTHTHAQTFSFSLSLSLSLSLTQTNKPISLFPSAAVLARILNKEEFIQIVSEKERVRECERESV